MTDQDRLDAIDLATDVRTNLIAGLQANGRPEPEEEEPEEEEANEDDS